jgi:bifunctional non-homologous end joining protein LigD
MIDVSQFAGAKKARLPDMVPFELATLVDEPPVGGDWVHEIKLDGFRMQCRIEKGRAQLLTRTGQDWTHRFRGVAEEAARLAVQSALLDGELVALQPDGRSSFQLLQQALSEGGDVPLVYYAFDLLHLNGYELVKVPLEGRKAALSSLLSRGQASGAVRYSEHFAVEGAAFFEQACRLQLEGMISKRRTAPYRLGRGRDWVKVKCLQRQEFVVGGFTEPAGSRTGLGALLVGVHDGDRFLYAGRVGTGFNAKMLESLRKHLASLEQPRAAFHNKVPGPLRGIHWVAPRMVVEIAFTEWTSDGLLRHPSFQGIREDKKPSDVKRESPEPMETAMKPNPPARPQRSVKNPEIAGIRLTNPDKVLYPGDGITKLDLARYYESIADWVLPHVAGRPLTIVRCPEGYHKPCFFQKHFNDTVAKEVHSLEIKEGGKKAPYLMIDDLSGLIALAQMGVLELHVWGSLAARLEYPDRMVFDLDPDESLPWSRVVEAARLVKDRLSAMDLQSWVKTTGGKGLHVVVPLSGKQPWDDVKAFSQAVAEGIARDAPDRYTSKMSKAGRTGKVFIDYLRNGRGATFVAAYSTRARRGATVSVQIRWEEAGKVEAAKLTVQTVPRRLQKIGQDPWKDLWETRQQITRAAWKAAGLK